MSDELFDFERLRRNWEAEPVRQAPLTHRVLARVVAATDPFEDALRVLQEIEEACLARFPQHREPLQSFLRDLREGLEALGPAKKAPPAPAASEAAAQPPPNGASEPSADAAPEPEPDKPAEQAEPAQQPEATPEERWATLEKTLDRFEDLLEVFAFLPEPPPPRRPPP